MSAEAQRGEQRPLLSGRTPELEFLFPDIAQNSLLLENLHPNPFVQGSPILFLRLGKSVSEVAFWQKENGGKVFSSQLMADFIKESSGLTVGGMVIRLDSLSPSFLETVNELVGNLKENSGVWILEKVVPLSNQERGGRETMLEAWGLVERKVVGVKGTPFSLWYGRTEKSPAKREGVDLTAKPWFEFCLGKAVDSLWENGWERVDLGEAVDTCRQSRFPPLDLSNLRCGFGAKVSAPCGCRWHIDKSGGWERIESCGVDDCEGIPEEKIFWVGHDIPTKEVLGRKMVCYDCREGLVLDRVEVQSSGKSKEISSDLKCPHCGLISHKVLPVDAKTKIVKYQPVL